MGRRRVIIIGAAGRDFHNFNTRYRDDATVEVVAFAAVQIPGIEDASIRRNSPVLSIQTGSRSTPVRNCPV
jgi:predicted GTPase